MTAIGTFCTPAPTKQPILVGDLAVSGPEPDHDVRVPTIGSTREVFARVPGFPGEVVRGCLQKVIICHDRLAVAWAGNRIAAQAVLRELDALEAPDIASVIRVIEAQADSTATRDLSLLGLLVELDEEGRPTPVRQFYADGTRITFALGGFFRGTGAERMATTVGNNLRSLAAASLARTRGRGAAWQKQAWQQQPPDPIADSVSAVFGVLGMLMNIERSSLQTLLEYFGGGYEIACWNADHNRFEKVESAVHLFWNSKFVDNRLVFEPCRILRPKYVGRLLVVYAAGTDSFIEGGADRVERYLISPPHEGAPTVVPDDPSRFGDAPWVCNHFIVNETETLLTSMSSGPELPVQVFDLPDAIELRISRTFLDYVAKLAALHDPNARRRRRNERKRKHRGR